MSLEELITSLSLEAEAERQNILLAAGEEADRIRRRALEEVERNSQGPRGEASRRLDSERARRLFAARAEGQGIVRKARGEVLEAVARRVLELAESQAGHPEWREFLRRLVLEAASNLAGGTIRVRPGDRETAAAAAAELPGTFRVEPDDALPPGVTVVSDDGLVEVDNTLPTRLARYLVFQEAEVAGLVFPEGRRA